MAVITFLQAIKDALIEEMRRDDSVFLIGEDIGVYGGCFGVTKGLLDEFGKNRVMDTPISEQALTGAATGAALAGMRPVAEIMFSDFITVCCDIVANEAPKLRYMSSGKINVPVTFRAPTGCGTGAAAQHSQSLEALFAHMPGLYVVMPATPYDAKGLLKSAIRSNNPVMFLEPKTLYKTEGEVPEEEYIIDIGKADIKKQGKDISIITYGRTLREAAAAAGELEKSGISAEVVDIRSLKPFDAETVLMSVKKTGRALIVHEAITFCGFGAEIAAQISQNAFYDLKKPVTRLGAPDCPVPFNKKLEAECCPSAEKIISAAKEMLK